MRLSVIVPVLNEERMIAPTLRALRLCGEPDEIVVVDGGSTDSTVELARPLCDLLLQSERGRARQMNIGAAHARGEALMFVHADTFVPRGYVHEIAGALQDSRVVGGRFDVRLDDSRLIFRMIGRLISLRSRLSRVATGDQAIFVRRSVFERLGGFPEIDLCEDLAFTRQLKRLGRIACLHSQVTTSARRWQRNGITKTILTMWLVRLLFLAGVEPARLREIYSD